MMNSFSFFSYNMGKRSVFMVTNYYPYNSSRNVYRNMPSYRSNQVNYPNEQRGLFFPFVVGGLAGTALGYGIANNNYNRPPLLSCRHRLSDNRPPVYYQPYYYQPYYPPYQMSGPYYY